MFDENIVAVKLGWILGFDNCKIHSVAILLGIVLNSKRLIHKRSQIFVIVHNYLLH